MKGLYKFKNRLLLLWQQSFNARVYRDNAGHPGTLLSREEMLTNNLTVQFIAHPLFLLYKLKLSKAYGFRSFIRNPTYIFIEICTCSITRHV